MDVSLALAFAAGLLSFLSPCVLALVPVYLAFLGETAAAHLPLPDAGGAGLAPAPAAWRGPVFSQALLFVLGFSALFIVLGARLGLLGGAGFRVDGVRQVAGIAVIGL